MCDDIFSDNSANAICREMGYSGSSEWFSDWIKYSFGEVQTSLDINLDDVKCSNDDWNSCTYSTSHNCGHSEDVFLACTPNSKFCPNSVRSFVRWSSWFLYIQVQRRPCRRVSRDQLLLLRPRTPISVYHKHTNKSCARFVGSQAVLKLHAPPAPAFRSLSSNNLVGRACKASFRFSAILQK